MMLVFKDSAMSQTYRAILHKDHVRWTGEAPDREKPVDVYITVIGGTAESSAISRSGLTMDAALQEIADRGGLREVADASEWQREIRKDRELSGRDQ
jgi:hypothetical protein